MHEERGLQFKSFVPVLMELLEDADGMVRDSARHAVIELFRYVQCCQSISIANHYVRNAPPAAKSDIKKQLKTFNVRSTIATAIVDQIGTAAHVETEAPPRSTSSMANSRNQFAESLPAQAAIPTIPAYVPEAKVDHVDPAYVNTQRELEDIFRDMHPFFEGKESEGNWLKREQSCTKIRKLNAGNAPADFHDAFLLGIKGLLDGILKAVNSLRTSLSKEGCSVVQEVAKTAGPGLDPMVEILLQNLIKLCGGTKKISSQQGNVTVDIIISKVSYSTRIMQHIWMACQDKNVQPRTYATGWLKTLIKKEAHHKSHIEHSGGLDLIEKCIKKGLADPNPGVRESMRSTYWTFAGVWPAKAEVIMAGLDAPQQNKLENDPSNPNSPKKPESTGVRPGLGFSKSTIGPPKPSLRETMLAQKKAAMAARNLPSRPGSAMSTFSPTRSAPGTVTSTAPADHGSVKIRTEKTSAPPAHGGLSSAPMRPKVKARPEISRPATAGPYSVRRTPNGTGAESTSTSTSPVSTKRKPLSTSVSSISSPKHGSIPRPTTSMSTHSVQSTHSAHNSPAREKLAPAKSAPPKRPSPARPKSVIGTTRVPSPAKTLDSFKDEELTMVIPNLDSLKHTPSPTPEAPHIVAELNTPEMIDMETPTKAVKVYEDPFSNYDEQIPAQLSYEEPVLGEVPVNEDAANIMRNSEPHDSEPNGLTSKEAPQSPERTKQSTRLLNSGIERIQSRSLDVHGLRKLQGWIRDNNGAYPENKFELLLMGLFDYLEEPLNAITPEKEQDLKLQILTTINLLLKKDGEAFRPYVPRGLEALLATFSRYEERTRLASALEDTSERLITLAQIRETVDSLTSYLQAEEMNLEGCRKLTLGLHILEQLLRSNPDFTPVDYEVAEMGKLAVRCVNSAESGVRKEAVQFCVALHARIGEAKFWGAIELIRDDAKNLVTYYIAKGEREGSA
jgi:CLIP-associating protein 1/2